MTMSLHLPHSWQCFSWKNYFQQQMWMQTSTTQHLVYQCQNSDTKNYSFVKQQHGGKNCWFCKTLSDITQHAEAHTQAVVQPQHSRAVSTRIAPLAFIPRRNAEVDHVTMRWHLHTFSHRALLTWCTALRRWGNFFFFSATTNFPYLREESRNGGETTPAQGPSLRVAQLPVMKISPVREYIHVRRCVWVAPIEPIDETHWERAYGALCHWCGGEYKVSKSSVVRTPEIYSEYTAILVSVVLVSDEDNFISRPVLMIGLIH